MKLQYKAVVFDFDGTICKTDEGIIKSAKYALSSFGYDIPENDSDLFFFIGPPLLITFQEKFGADAARAQELVKKYREYYTNGGMYECKLYDGIEETLKNLKKDGVLTAVASSKPVKYVKLLLEHFKISTYFNSICGVSFDADCEPKNRIISRALNELGVEAKDALVVGDRSSDLEGAEKIGSDCAGALWGYGSKVELTAAMPTLLFDNPCDVESAVFGFYESVLSVNNVFAGKILNLHEDTISLQNGIKSTREVIDHNGGVGICALTDDGNILMVRQFRAPYRKLVWEIPAGKLEKGEDPLEAAKRELSEECGVDAEKFTFIGDVYPSPGYCGEIIHLYMASGLTFSDQHLDFDEQLYMTTVPLSEAYAKCVSGKYMDSKTLAAIMKVWAINQNGNLS